MGRGEMMTLSRVLRVAFVLAVLPLGAARAQFGGMPGMPGTPDRGGMPGGFGAAPQGPPPACQKIMVYRDETAKAGQALQAAGKKKPGPEELCKLFKVFMAAETKFMKGLEENSATCGVPADVIKQVKLGHNKASETAKQVCDAAAQGARPAGHSLSDALGTTPTMPDTSSKRGVTFDTLTGSPLVQ